MTRKFQRNIEDFICERCGEIVMGDGYTNHCPACLWSKHVDINPGDRAEDCLGLMQPVAVETKNGHYRILHRCIACGHERWNKTVEIDDFDVILKIAARQNHKP